MNSVRMREAFLNQYGQSVIIDLNNFDPESLQNITNVLKQVLSIGCSIRGGNRIPAFELSIITNNFTKLFDLNILKGNFNKISFQLNSLATYNQMNENVSEQEYKDILFLALNSTVLNFKSKLEKNELRLPNSKLEITIILDKSDEKNVENYINLFLENLDVVYIQKINVIKIFNTNNQNVGSSQDKNLRQVDTFLKTYSFDGHNLKILKNHFKNWLKDCSNDIGAILNFPSAQNVDIKLKCDINECILNPLALPFGHRFYLNNDSLGVQFIEINSSNITIFEVNIIARINSASICESTLLGLPFCLTPSKSWKLSYEEQISNEEYFCEICRQLGEEDKYLLGRISPILLTDQFLPYFVFIPGNSCMLVKSFASNDITMPWPEKNKPRSTISYGNRTHIHQTLQNLQQIENMSETFLESGLTSCLIANLERTRPNQSFAEEKEESFLKKRKRIPFKNL